MLTYHPVLLLIPIILACLIYFIVWSQKKHNKKEREFKQQLKSQKSFELVNYKYEHYEIELNVDVDGLVLKQKNDSLEMRWEDIKNIIVDPGTVLMYTKKGSNLMNPSPFIIVKTNKPIGHDFAFLTKHEYLLASNISASAMAETDFVYKLSDDSIAIRLSYPDLRAYSGLEPKDAYRAIRHYSVDTEVRLKIVRFWPMIFVNLIILFVVFVIWRLVG